MKKIRTSIQTMFWSASRELRRLLHDPNLFLVLFIAPLAYPALYGAIYWNKIEEAVPVCVVDMDRSVQSRRLTRAVDALQVVRVVDVGGDEYRARTLLEEGRTHATLLIPEGFDEKLKSGAPVTVSLLLSPGRLLVLGDVGIGISQCVSTYGVTVTGAVLQRQGVPVMQEQALAQPLSMRYSPVHNPWLTYGDMILPALLGIILLQLAFIGTAAATASEWVHDGWKEIADRAQTRMLPIAVGKVLLFVAVFLVFCMLIAITLLPLFDVQIAGNPALLLLLLVLAFAAASALGLFLGSFFHHRITAFIVLGFTSYPFFMLSGYAWPADQLPTALLWLAQLLPTTPFLTALNTLTQNGAGVQQLWPSLVTLLCHAAGYTALATLRFNSIRQSCSSAQAERIVAQPAPESVGSTSNA